MFAVLDKTIQHFSADNLSYFKNSGYIFFDDDGNKIDDADVDAAAEKEIAEHTVTIKNTPEALKKSLEEHGFLGERPFSVYPSKTMNDNPIAKIREVMQAGEV